MNGRVYDPTLGRFMSADPYIQAPDNLLSYNRYSYCIGNPLICTDPSGYNWWSKNITHNKALKVVVAAVAAWYLGPLVTNWAYASMATSAASAATAAGTTLTYSQVATMWAASNAIGGAAAGFSAGFISSGGNVQAGLYGAAGGAIGGAFAGSGTFGQMIGSGVNGYLQTGTPQGFARGFAAGAIPQDMWFGDVYKNDGFANVSIGIARDGIRGSITAGSLRGFAPGVAYGQGTNLIGHAIGFLSTGSIPKFRDGIFFYEGKLYGDSPTQGSGLTIGNVISGPRGLRDSPESTLYMHERDHFANPTERALGALYIPAHVLDLVMGYSVRGLGGGCSGFVIEEHVQSYPYSSINPGLCR